MAASPAPRALVAALLVGGLAACNGDPSTDRGPTPPTPMDDTAAMGDDPFPMELASSPSDHVPSVLHLTGTAPPGATRVHATATSPSGHVRETEIALDAGPSFRIPLPGLVADTAYDVLVEAFDPTGEALATDTLPLTAPAAPAILHGIQGQRVDQPIGTNYVAFALIDNEVTAYLVILDPQARVVWWKQAQPGQALLTPVLSRDGEALLWGEYDADRGEDTGTWYRVRLDGTELTSRPIPQGHHAAVEMPDGGVAWLALDWRTVENTDGEAYHMASDRIYEGSATDDATFVERFNTFDDHGGPPAFTCKHITDPFERFGESGMEWTHGNSLAYLESEDAFYLNAKFTDWLLKIDRSTGHLLWQLGGYGSDFTFPDGSPTFTSALTPALVSHGHMSEVWEGGMVIYDNGDHRTPPVSAVSEYAWNEEERTVERVWTYPHPEGGHTYVLGDVKKLQDGTYLVGWGGLSELMVVTPDHRVTWHVTVPSRYIVGRVLPLEHL